MKPIYLCLLTLLLLAPACIKRPEIGTCVLITGDTFGGKVGRVASFTGRFTLIESGTQTYAIYSDGFEVIPEKYCEEFK